MRKAFGGHAEKAVELSAADSRSSARSSSPREAAAQLVEDGMTVGLGTGSTAAYLLAAARRAQARHPLRGDLAGDARRRRRRSGSRWCRSPGSRRRRRLDLTIDGADQVDPSGWLVKGGGGAHTREKAVAAAADRFIVIVSANKLVDELAPPIPLELAEFGLAATLRRARPGALRDVPHSPDGGVIADYLGAFDDPAALATLALAQRRRRRARSVPAAMVAEVLIGRGQEVERMTPPVRRSNG